MNEQEMYIDEPIVRRVRSPGPSITGFVCVLFCCVVFFAGLLLAFGFFFTLRLASNSSTTTLSTLTSTTLVSPSPTPPLLMASFCTGFFDLEEAFQPQISPCSTTVAGRCGGLRSCNTTMFRQTESTERSTRIELCTVAPTVCTATNLGATCMCQFGATAACARNLAPIGETTGLFECIEPLGCTFFDDVPIAQQSIDPNFNCTDGPAALLANGTCPTVGSTLCRIPLETVGSDRNDNIPTPLVNCDSSTPCLIANTQCRCLAAFCVRSVAGIRSQFRCLARSVIPAPNI